MMNICGISLVSYLSKMELFSSVLEKANAANILVQLTEPGTLTVLAKKLGHWVMSMTSETSMDEIQLVNEFSSNTVSVVNKALQFLKHYSRLAWGDSSDSLRTVIFHFTSIICTT